MSDTQRRSHRSLPVRPNLEQLKHQAKDLLRGILQGDPAIIDEFNKYHPRPIPIAGPGKDARKALRQIKLADAQLALARSYEAPSWSRLVQACKLVDAIWE